MSVSETIYVNRDNKNDLILKADGEPQNISALTRVSLIDKQGNTLVNSTSSSTNGPFDWTTDGANGRLIMKLGAHLTTKKTYKDIRLVVYDAINTNGIVWVDDLVLVVK